MEKRDYDKTTPDLKRTFWEKVADLFACLVWGREWSKSQITQIIWSNIQAWWNVVIRWNKQSANAHWDWHVVQQIWSWNRVGWMVIIDHCVQTSTVWWADKLVQSIEMIDTKSVKVNWKLIEWPVEIISVSDVDWEVYINDQRVDLTKY